MVLEPFAALTAKGTGQSAEFRPKHCFQLLKQGLESEEDALRKLGITKRTTEPAVNKQRTVY